MSAAVDAKEQVQWTFGTERAVGAIQTFVSMLCAAPDGVLDGTVDVILRVALDDKDPSVLQVPVKVFGVVIVEGLELL